MAALAAWYPILRPGQRTDVAVETHTTFKILAFHDVLAIQGDFPCLLKAYVGDGQECLVNDIDHENPIKKP